LPDGDRKVVEEVLEALVLERLGQFRGGEQIVKAVGTADHSTFNSQLLMPGLISRARTRQGARRGRAVCLLLPALDTGSFRGRDSCDEN
jgi:hypothetical protein